MSSVCAFAPNLHTAEDWHDWVSGNREIGADRAEPPDISFIPANFRRRLSENIKMALYVAHGARRSDESASLITRLVFASRFGEWQQTTKLLGAYQAEDSISPAGFSLSVHNAAAGLASVISGDKTPYSTVAAGEDTIAMAMLEALLYIDTGRVLLAYSDEAAPELYSNLYNRSQCAVGLVLSKEPSPDAIHVRCTIRDSEFYARPNWQERDEDSFDFITFCLGEEKEIALRKIYLKRIL